MAPADAQTASLFLHLSEGASIARNAASEVLVQFGAGTATFRKLSPALVAALHELGSTGGYETVLADQLLITDGIEGLTLFYSYLQKLGEWQLLIRSVVLDDAPIATLAPIASSFQYAGRSIVARRRYRLSRFAFSRVREGAATLESPLGHARITLDGPQAALIVHALAQPRRLDELCAQVDVPAGSVQLLMTLMLNACMLTEVRDTGKTSEDENISLRSWEFHDLLFHSRSRLGRHDEQLGSTFRFAGELDPPVAVKPTVGPADGIVLYRPDIERLKREDPPFALIQEERRSIRHYDTTPVSLHQLGEFLYRVARVTQTDQFKVETSVGPVVVDIARRPYPAGGALYELELYIAVRRCENLAAGLYHYDSKQHQLKPIPVTSADLDGLLAYAGHASGISFEHLQVLILITARFQRIAWKYASIAYALTLKHVGVMYQTMYLAATAMRLAPCALGSGDGDLFARAARTNYHEETSVGEFLIGSKPLLKEPAGEVETMGIAEPYQKQLLDQIRLVYPDNPISKPTEQAFFAVPRHLFVRRYRKWATRNWNEIDSHNVQEHLATIYSDAPLCLFGEDDNNILSTISQPSFVLRMLDMLQLRAGQTVLELGAGSGWNAALIGHLVGAKGSVYSLEIIPDVARTASDNIKAFGSKNVHVVSGDGGDGYAPGAPYDRAVFTAGAYDLPLRIHEQVKNEGLLLAVVKVEGGGDTLFLLKRRQDHFESHESMPCGFVQLQGRYQLNHLDPITLESLPEWNGLQHREVLRTRFWWGWRGKEFFVWRTLGIRWFLAITEPSFCTFKTEQSAERPLKEFYFGLFDRDRRSLVLAKDDWLIAYGNSDALEVLRSRIRQWVDLGMPSAASFTLRIYPITVPLIPRENEWIVHRKESQFLWGLPAMSITPPEFA
jgi:protein-L-isoaspartate(D-aspartate) O-methyltransferase